MAKKEYTAKLTGNRLNPKNGICLSALYDWAFDSGLITFDRHYQVMLSLRLKDHCSEDYYQKFFESIEGFDLYFAYEDYKPELSFLEYHCDSIFQR